MIRFLSILLCASLVCGMHPFLQNAEAVDFSMPAQLELFEDFETVPKLDTAKGEVRDIDGNHAFYLRDALTEVVYTPKNSRYRLSGRFKVESVFGERSLMEFLPQRRAQPDFYYGGQRGTPFVVDFSRQYLRIGAFDGPDIVLAEGWNQFSLTVLGELALFAVNDVEMTARITPRSGGFAFRVEGAEIALDDIKVESITAAQATEEQPILLAACLPHITVSPYEALDYVAAAGLIAQYADGGVRAATEADVRLISSTAQIRELSDGYGYIYSEGALTFACGDAQTSVYVTVESGNMTEEEYVAQGIYKRRDNALYQGIATYNNGVPMDSAGSAHLFYITAPMTMYPRSQNWDAEVKLYYDMLLDTSYAQRATGAEDFIVLALMIAAVMPQEMNLSAELRQELETFLQGLDYSNPHESLSENHRLTYYACGMLAFEKWPENTFYNGYKAKDNIPLYRMYLAEWTERRLKYGMGEYDSGYYGVDFSALEALYTYIQDTETKRIAYEMLCYLYTELANDASDSLVGGAQSRIYINTLGSKTLVPLDIMFDTKTVPETDTYLQMLPVACSSFVPPAGLITMQRDETRRYVNLERRKIYEIPDDDKITESLVKYTYVTPNYTVGSVVRQDEILSKTYEANNKYYINTGTHSSATRVAPSFSDLSCAVSIGGDPFTNIIEHHPGQPSAEGETVNVKDAHAYFAGDHGCSCSQYAQFENTVLGMRQIENADTAQYSHFYLNRAAFEMVEESDGWVFAAHKGVYVAIRPLKDNQVSTQKAYEWGSESVLFAGVPLSQVEIKVDATKTAFVMEVADNFDFSGSFAEFQEAIKGNTLSYQNDVLCYTNLKGQTLSLDFQNSVQTLNSVTLSYEDAKTEDSPYLKGEWGAIQKSYTLPGNSFVTPQANYLNLYRCGYDQYRIDPISETGQLYLAFYSAEGALLSVQVLPANRAYTVALPETAASLKAFLLESLESLRPLTGTVSAVKA